MSSPCRYAGALRHWQPLLPSHQLGHRPLLRWLAGERIVLFRTAAGQAAALADSCSHRRMSLAAGRVQGDQLVCAYHGWRFGVDGAIHCPLMASHDLQHQAYALREERGVIWVRRAQSGEGGNSGNRGETDPPLPHWDTTGLELAGITVHTVPAPLELTLDNFTEVEHTSSVHQVFGFTEPAAIRHRLELEPTATRVWNSGPQKPFPRLFDAFIDIRPVDGFANDWVTTFAPLLTVYDQTWTSRQGRPRRFRLKVVMGFLPLDDQRTQLTTWIHAPRVLPGPLHGWFAAPIIRAITAHELNLDVAALSRLADLNPELTPRSLGPLDRVLLENRRRLRSSYGDA